MRLTFRPLEQWPEPETENRRPGPFFSRWTDTMKLLDYEVDQIVSGGELHTEAILEVVANPTYMRKDGNLAANAKVDHPGVILSFEGPLGPLRFVCDKWEGAGKMVHREWVNIPAWQMNLRAIAKGLNNLRMFEQYGIGRSFQQYQGFAALGSGIPMPAPQMARAEAIEVFRKYDPNVGPANMPDYGWRLETNPAYRQMRYRAAARTIHPDIEGGDKAKFQQLQEAKAVLDA